jgi:pimeloyl-ACP methyl ester carboxylesterase
VRPADDGRGQQQEADVADDQLVIEGGAGALLVFLPGFMIAPTPYRALLAPSAAAGATVVVPSLYRRGVGALLGRAPVGQEAQDAAALVRRLAAQHPGRPVVLGGHSRGGQAAWRAAGILAAAGSSGPAPDSLVLVDPVDGEGRAPASPTSTAAATSWRGRTLVIGAGLGGRCAPEPVNHDTFAAAAPWSGHVVVRALGHADILEGRAREFGRRLCPGASDPDPGRSACGALIAAFVAGAPRPAEGIGGAVDVLR